MTLALRTTLILVFACLAQSPAQAGPIEDAHDLISKGQIEQAFNLLSPLEAERAGDPGFDYLLGISALDSGRVSRAIFALERAVEAEPGNALYRAEMARAYFTAGEVDAAKAHFDLVRDSRAVPDAAKPAISKFLASIEQVQSQRDSRWGGHLELGIGHDSNVNSGPSSSQLALPALGGTLFTLDSSSTPKSASFVQAGGALNLHIPIDPEWTFRGQASFQQSFNSGQSRYDFGTLGASTGLGFRRGKSEWSGTLHAGHHFLSGSTYRRLVGTSVQWQYDIDALSQATIFGQWTASYYPDEAVRDAHRKVLGAGYAFSFGDSRPVVYASAYLGSEDETAASASHIGYTLSGARIGGEMHLAGETLAFANINIEDHRHGGTEPFFLESRKDTQIMASTGVHYPLGRDLRLTAQANITQNDSNIPVYQFDRSVFSLTLRKLF